MRRISALERLGGSRVSGGFILREWILRGFLCLVSARMGALTAVPDSCADRTRTDGTPPCYPS